MPGLLGLVRPFRRDSVSTDVVETIDLLHTAVGRELSLKRISMAAAFFTDRDASRGTLSGQDFSGYLFGDPVFSSKVNWKQLIHEFRSENFSGLKRIEGIFALAIYDAASERFYLANDMLGMQPLFYAQRNNELLFSTAIPTFVRLGETKIDERWIEEFMFFNYPLGARTFLHGVERLPAASVISFDLRSSRLELTSYSPLMHSSGAPLKGADAVDAVHNFFESRSPRYVDDCASNWVAITAGIDSRTVAAYIPRQPNENIRMYTYGHSNSRDVIEGRRTAAEYDFPHDTITLDTAYESDLLGQMRETVWLSGGIQKINRAHLTYSYKILSDMSEPYPVALTGIGGDTVFREHLDCHGSVPHCISPGVFDYINSQRGALDTSTCTAIFKNSTEDVSEYLKSIFSEVIDTYGNPRDPEAFFLYMVYICFPKYCGTELNLARNFVRLRSIFFEYDLLRLACNLEYATIENCRNPVKRSKFELIYLQANLINRGTRGKKITYRGIPIGIFAKGRRLDFEVARACVRGPERLWRRIKNQQLGAAENWERWIRPVAKQLLQRHGSGAFVTEYINDNYIFSAVRAHDIDALAKLWSLELILEMTSNGWSNRTSSDVN